MEKYYIEPEKFPIRLKDNVFILGNYFFNVFLIVGDKKTVLFETGISAVTDTIISQIESLQAHPDYIIPAHPHSDHITGLPGLMEKYPDATIITAKGAKEFIEHPKAGPLLIKEDKYLHKSLSQWGLISQRQPLEAVPNLKTSLIVENKESLDLGNITLTLIKVDGHSPGNLIAYIPELEIVFTSDSLGFHYPGRFFFPLFFTDLQDYLATIDLIRSFNPVTLCPAHQGHIEGEAVNEALKKTLGATHKIVDLIKQNKYSDDVLAEKLFNYCFIDEFTLYTKSNIRNCVMLLIKRVNELKR
ncbi:MAG: MBL fold metallo-hydrolase [Desulfobacteraceae bacterium]|nr:MBL fold metallo-hydrolase [Desulfobacteraceae bacterium]